MDSQSVIFEDNHLLVVSKPAGMATMGALPGETSLFDEACQYLKDKYNKPGNVYLGVVSRLDSFVSGVLVFARTSKAASRLSEQFRAGQVSKRYLAVVPRMPSDGIPGKSLGNSDDAGKACWYRLDSHLRKNDRLRRVESFEHAVSGSKQASLEFRVLRSNDAFSLLEVNLLTGRKHQIRVQLAENGFPIYADQKYDSPFRMNKQIALHARSLTITHPTLKDEMTFTASVPGSWYKVGRFSDLLDGF